MLQPTRHYCSCKSRKNCRNFKREGKLVRNQYYLKYLQFLRFQKSFKKYDISFRFLRDIFVFLIQINSSTEQTEANLSSVIYQSVGFLWVFLNSKSSSNSLQISLSYVCVFQEIVSCWPLLGLFETNVSKSPSDAISLASSSSLLLWFSFSKADLFTAVETSRAYLCSTNKRATALAFNRFLLEYGLIKLSDVKCSLQILVCRIRSAKYHDLSSSSRSKQRGGSENLKAMEMKLTTVVFG